MWVMGRITWLLARLYNTVEKREDWLRWARHGIDFIRRHGFDSDGRMFYAVTRDGRPLRKRRYLFTETFGVIALAEFARAAGDEQALQHAGTRCGGSGKSEGVCRREPDESTMDRELGFQSGSLLRRAVVSFF
jgi:N-acylglucosamine 2-epimerase